MNAVDEEFLLGLAGVSAALLGTFIVGVFFYINSDMHRRLASSQATDVYLRSGTTSHPGQWQIGHVPCIRDQ